MAHTTGTADTFHDLLSQFCTWIAAQGWTVDYNAVEGSGRRAHISKGSVHAHFRAFSNEWRFGQSSQDNTPAPFGSDYQHYGLSMNVGTAAGSGTGQWDQQTGAPQNSNSKYLAVEMRGPLGTTGNTYHFFSHTSPDQFFIFLEDKANPGFWQFLAAGILDKTVAGTYTGGEWFTGSNCCQLTSYKMAAFGTPSVVQYQNFFARVNFTATAPSTDDFSGWLGFDNGASGGAWTGKGVISTMQNIHAGGSLDSCGVPNFSHAYAIASNVFRAGPPYYQFSKVSTIHTLLQYRLYMNRGTLSGRKGYSNIGMVPNISPANLMAHQPGDAITIGSDTWYLFPANRRGQGSESGTGAGGVGYYNSDYLGIAVKA